MPSQQQSRRRDSPRPGVDGIHRASIFEPKHSKLTVIGLDRAGLSLCARAASRELRVVGFDSDEVKVAQLEDKSSETFGKDMRTLSITADESMLGGADTLVVSAPEDALEGLVRLAANHTSEHTLVIASSRASPGTSEHLLVPLLEKISGIPRRSIQFAYAPQRRASNTPVVVGASDEETLSRAAALYRYLFDTDVVALHSTIEAEAVPMLEDAFYDVNLALADEFAVLFDRISLDASNVLRAAAPEIKRALPAFPGIAIAKSSETARYIARSGHSRELERQLLATAQRVITRMPGYVVKLLSDAMRERRRALKGSRVAFLWMPGDGVAGSQEIVSSLKKKGAAVQAFDPHASDQSEALKRAFERADAVLIASPVAPFCNLTPRQFEAFGIAVVVDACNCLDKAAFKGSPVAYRGIGRG